LADKSKINLIIYHPYLLSHTHKFLNIKPLVYKMPRQQGLSREWELAAQLNELKWNQGNLPITIHGTIEIRLYDGCLTDDGRNREGLSSRINATYKGSLKISGQEVGDYPITRIKGDNVQEFPVRTHMPWSAFEESDGDKRRYVRTHNTPMDYFFENAVIMSRELRPRPKTVETRIYLNS
jgi:hypothetical protein